MVKHNAGRAKFCCDEFDFSLSNEKSLKKHLNTGIHIEILTNLYRTKKNQITNYMFARN